jgi:hypothetical protein
MEPTWEDSDQFRVTYSQWNGWPTGLRCPNPRCGGQQVWRYSFEYHDWFRGCTNYPSCAWVRDRWNRRIPQYQTYRRARTGCLLPLITVLAGLATFRAFSRRLASESVLARKGTT